MVSFSTVCRTGMEYYLSLNSSGIWIPVGWQPEVADLAQVIHAVQHWEDLLRMPQEKWEQIIHVTCRNKSFSESSSAWLSVYLHKKLGKSIFYYFHPTFMQFFQLLALYKVQ